MAASTGLKQVVGSVLLAVLAQPIHELGHAVALRASTGVWPRIGALSVQPLVPLNGRAGYFWVWPPVISPCMSGGPSCFGGCGGASVSGL